MKTIVHPTTGRSFKLGRRPIARCPRLSLRNYLLKSFPTAPAFVDYSAAPAAFLAEILGNDMLGDCTAAGAFHVGGTLLANAGQPVRRWRRRRTLRRARPRCDRQGDGKGSERFRFFAARRRHHQHAVGGNR